MNWRNLKLGDKIAWVAQDDFDPRIKPTYFYGEVTSIETDHVLAIADDMRL